MRHVAAHILSSLSLAYALFQEPALMGRGRLLAKNIKQISSLIEKADAYYETKQFDKAITSYSKILQLDPQNTIARIRLGKCFYRQGLFQDAYSVHKFIDLNLMDADTRYEFGLSAFKSKEFKHSLKIFSTIQKNHPFHDLANFYGSLSAARLGDYRLGLTLMQNAVVLPSKLNETKQKVELQLQRLVHGQPKKEQTFYKNRSKKTHKNPKTQKPLIEEAMTENSLPASNFYSYEIDTPNENSALGFLYQSQGIEQSLEKKDLSFVQAFADINLNDKLRNRRKESPTRYWLKFRLNFYNEHQRFYSLFPNDYENLEEKLRFKADQNGDSIVTTWLGAGISPSWRLNHSLWLIAGGELLVANQAFESEDTIADIKVVSALVWKKPSFTAKMALEWLHNQSSDESLYDKFRAQILAKIELGPWVNIKLGILPAFYKYSAESIDGPSAEFRLFSQANINLNTAVNFTLSGHTEYFLKQRLHNQLDTIALEFDQNNIGAQVAVILYPDQLISAGLSAKIEQRYLTNFINTSEELLHVIVPKTVQAIEAQASINF